MRRFAWSVIMLLLGGAVGLVLAAVWIGVVTHPDPGHLVINMALVSLLWLVWMAASIGLFVAFRDQPSTAN